MSLCHKNNRDTALESWDIAFSDCATTKYVHTAGTLYAHIGTQQAQEISKCTIFIIHSITRVEIIFALEFKKK